MSDSEAPGTSSDPGGPLLPWHEVRHEAIRATRRTWPALLGVPLGLALVAGVVQWIIDGANEHAWDGVTGSAFAASLITFAVAILAVVLVQVALAPVLVARRKLQLRDDQIRQLQKQVARDALPPTPLEDWLRERIDEANALARQRPVRGDAWYLDAMSAWDTANIQQMALDEPAVAPDLFDAYRRHERTGLVDGIPPPHGPSDYEDYYARRLGWLEETLEQFATGEVEPEPEISEEHRNELQEVAAGVLASISMERKASYHPPDRNGSVELAQSFREHFPCLARALDEWDALHDELWDVRRALWDWEAREWHGRAQPGMPGLVISGVVESGGHSLPWDDASDYLMLPGVGMLELKEGVDVEAFKRPYDEFLAEALKSEEAADLRRLVLEVGDAKSSLQQALRLIGAKHVIRGRCYLCT